MEEEKADMRDFSGILPIMERAGQMVLSAHDVDAAIRVKPGDANFVTDYDVAVQDFLYEELGRLLPEAVVIAEESEENHTELLASSLCLIIDPIDGTTNFIHNYRYSSISVGVCDRGRAVFGAVMNPYSRSIYHAEAGGGAFLFDTSSGTETGLSVSSRPLDMALVGFGTSPYYRDELTEITFRAVEALFLRSRDVRRSGSAALDLSMTAAGSLDLFLEYRLSPWDVAAGSLLVTEAGGVITRIDGSPVTFDAPGSILAGNPRAYEDALKAGIL